MAFVNINSKPTVLSACDLFTVPPTQRSVIEGYTQEFRPISSLDSYDAPIEFSIPASGTEYLDLSHTRIRIRVQILTEKGEAVGEKSNVAPINNFAHSLFSSVQILLNNKSITSHGVNYSYRSILENILNYGNEAKSTHLTSSLYYKDTAGSMNAIDANLGYVKRREFARQGEFDLESTIHSDLFNTNRYLINGVHLQLKMYRSKAEFALMTTAEDTNTYKIKITDATLLVRKLKVSDALLIAHATTMLHHSCKYPIVRCEVKNFNIPKGLFSYVFDNVILGQIPQRVGIAFVTSASYNGELKSNPYNFQHFNHNFLNISTDSTVHITPLKPDYKRKLYIQSYNTLFSGTGINWSDSGNDISRDEFAKGYNINIFDLTPDQSSSDAHHSQPNTGSLRVEVQFEKALTEPITAIVFLEYNNIIEIDKHRSVSIDYSA